jgi:dihydrofolate reductase
MSFAIKITNRERNSLMRKVIVIAHISLDGVIQAPGGPEEDTSGGFVYGGWVAPFSDEVVGSVVRRQMNMPFDLLLGRKTYDIWAPYWPHHADIWQSVNSATKYIASSTMTSGDWQPSIFLSGDVAEKVNEIKHQPGPDLHVYGSAELLQTLFKHDVVDALWLKIYPLTLGSGKRLFADGTIPATFTVTESTVSPKGVIIVNYEQAGGITTGSF